MASTISCRLRDGFITMSGVGLIAAGMAAVDETSRQYIFDALHGDFPALPAWMRFHSIAKFVSDALPVANTPFVAFAIVAFVLVVFMFRM